MLSKQDGISVLKNISGMDRKPVTLATTCFVSGYISAAIGNLGVRYLMLKPCDMTALVERLEEIRGALIGSYSRHTIVLLRSCTIPYA